MFESRLYDSGRSASAPMPTPSCSSSTRTRRSAESERSSMAAVISMLRNDVDVIASFDDAKREAFEAHCARHAFIDSKTFISGLSDIVGKVKVSAAHLVAGWLWVVETNPQQIRNRMNQKTTSTCSHRASPVSFFLASYWYVTLSLFYSDCAQLGDTVKLAIAHSRASRKSKAAQILAANDQAKVVLDAARMCDLAAKEIGELQFDTDTTSSSSSSSQTSLRRISLCSQTQL